MKTRLARILPAVLLLTGLVASVNPQPSAAAVRTVGNGIFRVHMEDSPGQGAGVGTFTITTGPDHPAGEGKNVLFGDGFPGTSVLAMVDNLGVHYTNAADAVTGPGVVQLGDYVEHIGGRQQDDPGDLRPALPVHGHQLLEVSDRPDDHRGGYRPR